MDTVTFLGAKVPVEIKKLYPIFGKLQQPTVQQILVFTIQILLKEDETTEEKFDELATKLQLDKQILSIALTAFYILLRSAVRTRIKMDALEKDLTDLKFPAFVVSDIVKIIKSSQNDFEEALSDKGFHYPSLDELKWRVDVTISTSSMARVLKPSILMQLGTTDGEKKTFDLSLEKFHELRYNVAKVLKEMETLEKNPILKITTK